MGEKYQIGEIGNLLDLSADTLRYYEKIGLLTDIQRTPANTDRKSVV